MIACFQALLSGLLSLRGAAAARARAAAGRLDVRRPLGSTWHGMPASLHSWATM